MDVSVSEEEQDVIDGRAEVRRLVHQVLNFREHLREESWSPELSFRRCFPIRIEESINPNYLRIIYLYHLNLSKLVYYCLRLVVSHFLPLFLTCQGERVQSISCVIWMVCRLSSEAVTHERLLEGVWF